MSALGNLARDTANRLGGSGRAFADSVKNFSWKNPNIAEFVPTPPGRIEKVTKEYLTGFVGKPLSWGLKFIDATAAFFLTPVKWLASAPGSYFKAFPRFAPVSVAAGAVMGVGSWLAHRRSNAMVDQYAMTQEAAIQAAAMNEAMAAQAQQPAYRLQPGEHAAVDARIAADKAAGIAPASHTANVEAAKAQAASATSVA